MFFFAGHAVEHRDNNYLFSIDYKNAFNEDTSLTIDRIQNKLFEKNNRGLKLIIVDACRNNPVLWDSPIPKKSKANNNTLVAFSTSSGNTAKDGKGNNSLYTYYLVENIKKYGLSISAIFSKTRESVMNITGFSQIPWEYSSLLDNYEFTFDNILVPNKLKRIIRSKFKLTYSATYFKDVFYSVGDSNNFDMFDVNSSIVKKMESQLVQDDGSIEKIASNSDVLAFISDSGQFGAINLSKQRLTSCEFNESLFSLSINNDGIAIVGGSFDKLKVIDINSEEGFEIDLSEEILSKMYDDAEQIKHAASELNIMTICFSKKDGNIFAFGGSGSVFGIMDLSDRKCSFFNNDTDDFTYTYCVDYSDDGKYILSSHESGKVNLWCAKTYKKLYTFKINENIEKNEFFEFKEETHCNHMHHVRFLPNSQAFAVSTSESQVIFFDVCMRTMIDKIDLNIEPLNVYSFEFTSGGNEMVISIGNKHYLLTSNI
ncbi:hypothetical protein HJ088_23720 [Vibrio parahaemolyticus]|nr:caspase family protein [Vibrio parahaemolyticus]MBE4200684.1 hypothetical protein [Vibrio parahaemolyticus]MBE5128104.1 hypothetical protein [Vibrio parahaemolyticus]HBC0007678.1 caspase family protein [Vibrio parahaemolyticus]HBN6190600.1 caspase family protein [Vibrio parahaemolyticus]